MAVLCSFDEKSILKNNETNEIDRIIIDLVEEHKAEYYDGLIPSDSPWEVFMNLTRMRNSLLNWYSFVKDAAILEIGSGYGALTGILCDRGEQVIALENSMIRARIIRKRYSTRENLKVYAGTLDQIQSGSVDYIVVTGELPDKKENRKTFLEILRSKLKCDGKILIATQNRFGLKYFCGETDEFVHIPFEGINKYPNGGKSYLLSRQELIDCVTDAGLKHYKMYYPMPDYKLTQVVYTDEYMPKGSIRDRVIPYYMNPQNLVAIEDRIYDDLIQNKVLHFFVNSFLIEASINKEPENSVYAALSTDREKAHAFATIIKSNDIVIKKALYPEGRAILREIYDNLCSLQNAGVLIVPVKLNSGCLEMPYIHQMNLADYLAEVIHRDKKTFENIIDELYHNILRSSEHVNISSCALNMKRIPEEEIGVILKEAYIDMIPYNCFYEDGKIYFYDQEFRKCNFPAKYILFRVLRYMYFYIADAESILPLQYFKEKYLLVRLWSIYERVEARFIDENRNCSSLSQFYQWAQVDRNKIFSLRGQDAQGLKEGDPEDDEELRAVKKVQLDIFKYFKEVCKKNDLRYCAIYGSLLGAVRHKGVIPWDDDIDIAMPRKDYDRLKKLMEDNTEEPYFFQFPENDPECFYGGYCKLRNSMTGGLEWRNKGHKCNQGIWIDIFPLDRCYENERKRNKHIQRINFCQQLLLYKVYPEKKGLLNGLPDQKMRIIKFISGIVSHRRLCKWLGNLFTECQEETNKIAILSRYLKPEQMQIFDKEDFLNSFEVEFEDTHIAIPIGYKHWLFRNVGSDYMIYPKKENRVSHHKAVYSADKSYREMI